MLLNLLTEEPAVARKQFLDYRNELRQRRRDEATREVDAAMRDAYKWLAKGFSLIRMTEALRAGGTEVRAVGSRKALLPRLALAQIGYPRVWTNAIDTDGSVMFSVKQLDRWSLSRDQRYARRFDPIFEPGEWEERANARFSARVPIVPPEHRPSERTMGTCHVLFEAEWQGDPVPGDPALVKWVGGDLWAVLATWDLTPLEAAVLGQTG